MLITESFAFRDVSVWVPEGAPRALVLCGDGQILAPWGADLDDVMIVGVHRVDDEDERIYEYSPAFKPEVFAAHESFLMNDARSWVRSTFDVSLPRERRAMFGVSASGELAIALGLKYPDVIGAIFCASPGGGYQPGAPLPSPLPRCYFTGGTDEPWFYENAKRWADHLSDAGADVVVTERNGNHGDPFWRDELPLMVDWAFG